MNILIILTMTIVSLGHINSKAYQLVQVKHVQMAVPQLYFSKAWWKREESEKGGLKLNIQKTKIMASSPITSWQTDRETRKQWQTLFSWAPKSLQMVTAAKKLKDACPLEEKLCQT